MGQGRQGSGCKSKRVKMKSIEEKLAANQLDRLAKHWSGMKGKRIQPTDAIKLSTMVAKFGKDELEQLAAKDIPFLSMAAINNLMIKHNYNAAKIKGLMKEDTELLYDLYMFEDVDAGEYDYEGDMAKTQLVTISDAAEELHDMLEDDENMPEWCQNKITKAMDYLDSVRDYMLAKDTGEEPGNENPNESVKLDELATPAMKKAGNELSAYAKKSGGIDKADFMKAANMLTSGKAGMPFIKFVNGQDTEVFEKIITVMSKHMGRQTVEKMFKVKVREEVELDAKVKGKDPKDLIKKEDVNELNKDTLQKYHKKTQDYMKTALKKDDPKMLKKYGKRLTGSGRANDRLKKMGTTSESKDDFEPHMMYDPKTGKGYMAKKPADHERMKKMGYGHDKPKTEGAMKRMATSLSNKTDKSASNNKLKPGLDTFKKKPQNEKLEVSDGMGAWIDDFKLSDAPQFKGKNAKERRDMAIAAYLDAKKDSE